VDLAIEIVLFQEWQQESAPAPAGAVVKLRPWSWIVIADGKGANGVMVILYSEANLLEVVLAAQQVGCLADFLNRVQKQANQNAHDGDDYQQFDQCKAATMLHEIRAEFSGARERLIFYGQQSREAYSALSVRTRSFGQPCLLLGRSVWAPAPAWSEPIRLFDQ